MIQLDPTTIAYGLGFDAGFADASAAFPGDIDTDEERERFNDGYADGVQARLVMQSDDEDTDG